MGYEIRLSGTRLGNEPASAMPITAPHWSERALCTQVDPELFFPPKGGMAAAWTIRAKKVCAECPIDVRTMCLDYALDERITQGIWGGMSASERKEILRKRDRGEVA